MTPLSRNSTLAQPSMVHHPPIIDLTRWAPPGQPGNLKDLHNANASPSPASHSGASHYLDRPPSHSNVAIHTHNTAPTPSSLTIRSPLNAQRLKANCKKFIGSFIGVLKGKSRQTRNIESTAILDKTTDTPPADRNTTQNNTWCSRIYIVYALSASTSDIMRLAFGAFDSQCAVDLMSRKYAAEILGIHFDNTTPELIGETITGGHVYSIGQVRARWSPAEDMPLSSPSGSELSFPPKFYDAHFYVVDSDRFEVIIGHPSLERNGIYGRKNMIAPFRSIVSSAGSSPANDAAQSQAHVAAVAAESARTNQFEQQQAQGSSKN